MNKYDFEIAKATISASKFEAVFGVIKHFLTLSAALGALYIIFEGLAPFIGQNPEAILAFAKLMEAVNPSNVTSYFIATILGVGWYGERSGRLRAIKQKSALQKENESGDAYRSTSGLTETGQTPEGDSYD